MSGLEGYAETRLRMLRELAPIDAAVREEAIALLPALLDLACDAAIAREQADECARLLVDYAAGDEDALAEATECAEIVAEALGGRAPANRRTALRTLERLRALASEINQQTPRVPIAYREAVDRLIAELRRP